MIVHRDVNLLWELAASAKGFAVTPMFIEMSASYDPGLYPLLQ